MRAIVTGAARGIGRAICRRLCIDAAPRGGAQLVLADQHEAEIQTLAEELRAQGARCTVLAGQLADPAYPDQLAAAARDMGGGSTRWPAMPA